MTKKRDINTREDLIVLLKAFYQKVFRDELIGHFFTDIMHVNMETHLPRITDFWETVLLNGNAYRQNAIVPHLHINSLSPMQEQHFKRWLHLFGETIDELYVGEVTETAKQRALSIATVMRIKIADSSPINIIK